MKLKIYFENLQEKEPITYKLKMLLRAAVFNTLAFEGFDGDVELSLSFVDNAQIADLNKRYRDQDNVTDVLSFPQYERGDDPYPFYDGKIHLGDIVLSLERAREQSLCFGHAFEREAAFLCVHSTLHLLGYDHISEEEDIDMRRRQREVMKITGLAIVEETDANKLENISLECK